MQRRSPRIVRCARRNFLTRGLAGFVDPVAPLAQFIVSDTQSSGLPIGLFLRPHGGAVGCGWGINPWRQRRPVGARIARKRERIGVIVPAFRLLRCLLLRRQRRLRRRIAHPHLPGTSRAGIGLETLRTLGIDAFEQGLRFGRWNDQKQKGDRQPDSRQGHAPENVRPSQGPVSGIHNCFARRSSCTDKKTEPGRP